MHQLSTQISGIIPVSDMERMAAAIATSGLFGIKDKNQALALMIVAQAEGRHPGKVASDYHIIQGKAALKADTMLARYQEAGGKVEWHTLTDEKADATFSHPSAGSLRIDWTLARASTAGLLSNAMWKKYPRAMLRSRCVSEGVRSSLPGVLGGMYEVSEVRDMAGPTEEEIDARQARREHEAALPSEQPSPTEELGYAPKGRRATVPTVPADLGEPNSPQDVPYPQGQGEPEAAKPAPFSPPADWHQAQTTKGTPLVNLGLVQLAKVARDAEEAWLRALALSGLMDRIAHGEDLGALSKLMVALDRDQDGECDDEVLNGAFEAARARHGEVRAAINRGQSVPEAEETEVVEMF